MAKDKQPYIAFFEAYFEYMDDLNPQQFYELMDCIRRTRWNGETIDPSTIKDKDVRLTWRSLKPAIEKSRRNAQDYQDKEAKNNPIDESKKEDDTEIPTEPQKPEIQPKNEQERVIDDDEVSRAVEWFRREENRYLIMEKDTYYYSCSSSKVNAEKYSNSGFSQYALTEAFKICRLNYREKLKTKEASGDIMKTIMIEESVV